MLNFQKELQPREWIELNGNMWQALEPLGRSWEYTISEKQTSTGRQGSELINLQETTPLARNGWRFLPICVRIFVGLMIVGTVKINFKKMVSLLLKGNYRNLGQHFYQYFYKQRQNIYRRITLPSFGSEGTNIPEKDISAYIESIRKYQPHTLEGLPLYLYTFAKYLMKKEILPPKVGVIKPFGGSMTSIMKETIVKAFGCEVNDTYGCSEMGFIACDCEKHEGLHLFMDLYHVEVCRNGKPVAPVSLGNFISRI